MTRPKRDSNPGSSASEADALTTRPARRFGRGKGKEVGEAGREGEGGWEGGGEGRRRGE